ncbi:MAG: hypothetical protein AAF517_08370 [Planctomycetota bacterium]
MGLKNFHILFIIFSVLICAGFGVWCFATPDGQKLEYSQVIGVLSFLAAVGIAGYGVSFVAKAKEQNL